MIFLRRVGVRQRPSWAVFAAVSLFFSLIPTVLAPLPALAADPIANPDLAQACGIDVLMVLDETGSMVEEATQLKGAYTDFVNALANTGSRVGVIEFSSIPQQAGTPDPVPGSPNSARVVTAGYLTPPNGTLTSYPASYNPTGYTNWQEALWGADNFEETAGQADLVLFFTDGDPNSIDGGNYGATNSNTAAAAAVDYANALKDGGTHMFGVGLGLTTASSETRLSTVTGTDEGALGTVDITTDDYVILSDANEIASALREVAYGLCAPSVTVTKYVPSGPGYDFVQNTGFETAPGWTFDGAPAAPGGVTGDSGAMVTDGSGQAQWQWQPDTVGQDSTFTLSETVRQGWGLLGGQCQLQTLGEDPETVQLDDSNNWQITGITDDTIVTCDVYNEASFLTLEKEVINDDGGTAADSAFTLKADGPATIVGNEGQGAVTSALVPGGEYVLSETGPAGYDQVGEWDCGNTVVTSGTLTLPIGDKVTCTVTNDDTMPTLTLLKEVHNDHGGSATPGLWTLTATQQGGPGVLQGSSGVSDEMPGGTYDLTEFDGPTGYSQLGWECGDHIMDGPNTVSISTGDNVICTVANVDLAGSLTLEKTVINDNGGGAVDTDFTLSFAGPSNGSGKEGDTGVTAAPVDAGNYDLSEAGPAGYSQTGDWDCGDASMLDGNTVTVGLNESVTCTVTNDDIAPILTLVKKLELDDGGDAVVGFFTLIAQGPVTISGKTGDAAITSASVEVGDYELSESGPSGYSPTTEGWVCLGHEVIDDHVVLVEGDETTCSIINDDDPVTLTLEKSVTNDNGGQLGPADFQLTLSDGISTVNVDQGLPIQGVTANTAYSVSEIGVNGYSQTGVVCIDDDTDQVLDHPVTLAPGQAATCTVFNDDDSPGIKVIKSVINDDGGDAVASDFQLTVNGEDVSQGVVNEFDAGVEYTIAEQAVDGYAFTGIVCEDAAGQLGHPFTLEPGQSVVCTVTNDDIAPSVILLKQVVNDDAGQAVPGDFVLEINGQPQAQGQAVAVDANTEYVLSETGPDGYDQTSLTCTDGENQIDTSPLVLTEGQQVTCTFVNDDMTPIPDQVLDVAVLPFTGLYTMDLAALALGLAGAGLLLLVAARRRREGPRGRHLST